MGADKQARNYMLTINNPGVEYSHTEIKKIFNTKFKTARFCAMCDEIGECGTQHTHVVLSFDSAVRFSTVKKRFPTAHIESIRNLQDSISYLKKEGKWKDTKKAETSIPGSYEEHGELPPANAGKNKLYENLYRMITEEHLTNSEIIRINQDYIGMLDTMTRIRTTYLEDMYKSKRRTSLHCTYIFGDTGTGKSRGILDKHGDENVYRVTDYSHPFDHYEMQDVIVFEEFRSSLMIGDMLKYLDIYGITLPARYASKYACYNYVYFATNIPLEEQYPELQNHDLKTWFAFLRRIHEVHEYTDNEIKIYNSVEEYFASKRIWPTYTRQDKKVADDNGFLKVEDFEDIPFQEELDFDSEGTDNGKKTTQH